LKRVVQENFDIRLEPFIKLMQVMQKDPLIHEKVMLLLKLDSYRRRAVLNNWLEQLRIRHASERLLSALSSLFDDNVAKEILILLNKTEC
jgi:hypothetical protein